jgi:hypothetical protein
MKRAHLRFGKGFRVALSNARAQIATMTLASGESEGDAHNRYRGTDQWLYMVRGSGAARVKGERYSHWSVANRVQRAAAALVARQPGAGRVRCSAHAWKRTENS